MKHMYAMLRVRLRGIRSVNVYAVDCTMIHRCIHRYWFILVHVGSLVYGRMCVQYVLYMHTFIFHVLHVVLYEFHVALHAICSSCTIGCYTLAVRTHADMGACIYSSIGFNIEFCPPAAAAFLLTTRGGNSVFQDRYLMNEKPQNEKLSFRPVQL